MYLWRDFKRFTSKYPIIAPQVFSETFMQLLPFKSTTYSATQPGKKLIVTGAVHGNEIHGTLAIRKLIAEIDAGVLTIVRGRVTFVPITNPKAYALKRRNGDRNLNRNLQPTRHITEYEDHVANWLCPLFAQHDVLLDLHSFQAPGQPFALIGPVNNTDALQPFQHAALEESLVRRLGISRVVYGWLDTYADGVARRQAKPQPGVDPHTLGAHYGVGTTEYMRSVGGAAITLECGQHDDASGPDVAYRAIRNTLAHLGITAEPDPAPAANMECLKLYDVIDREHANDAFSKAWLSFDPLPQSAIIGTRGSGEVCVSKEGQYIVFPNTNAAPGNEWYYLARRDHRL
jgi:uncharacterized protein